MGSGFLEFLDSPSWENIQKVHDMSGLDLVEAAAIANVSYDTYRSWRAEISSNKHRAAKVPVWNLFLFELEARRLGFSDLKALVDANVKKCK